MVRHDLQRWGQTLPQVLEQALRADHARTRERFPAVHALAAGTLGATA